MQPLRWMALILVTLPPLAGCRSGATGATDTATSTLAPYRTATSRPSATAPVPAGGTEEALRPSPTPFVHEVAEGETLLDIALRYGVELGDMLAANPGIDPRFLSIGQTLRIPGPEGEPVDTLLPTATPVPLELGPAACYPSPAGALTCLATVTNPTDQPVEGITGRVHLMDGGGESLATGLAFTPINRLPGGARLPLVAYFEAPTDPPALVRFSLLSAVPSVEAEGRYAPTEIGDLTTTAGPAGRRWQVKAELALPEAPPAVYVSLLALGYSAQGQVVGFTKWEPEGGWQAPYAIDLLLFTLGPPIQTVEVAAEAVIIPDQ